MLEGATWRYAKPKVNALEILIVVRQHEFFVPLVLAVLACLSLQIRVLEYFLEVLQRACGTHMRL